MNTDIDYYNIGMNITDMDELVVNSSCLQYIDPTQGGHPRLFVDYVTGKLQDKKSKGLQNGSLIHDYMEHEEDFIVSPVDKPTDSIVNLTKEFYKCWIDQSTLYKNTEIPEDIKVKVELQNLCKKLNGDSADYDTDFLKKVLYTITIARITAEYNKNLKTDTVIRHFRDQGLSYFFFLLRAENKVIISPSSKVIISNCIDSIKSCTNLQKLLNLKGKHLKECVILFKYRGLNCKSKLDRIIINVNTKSVVYLDYKSYGLGTLLHGFKPDSTMPGRSAVEKYKIYRQLAFYYKAIVAYLGETYPDINLSDWKIQPYVIGISTKYYECIPFKVRYDNLLRIGMTDLNNIISRIIRHYELGNWEKTFEELDNAQFTL